MELKFRRAIPSWQSVAQQVLVIAAMVLGAVGTVQAQSVEHTPIPRDPKPNFSSMAFLLGAWECEVASSRRPRPFATHVTATISADGYWLVTRTVTDRVPWNPITITNVDYMTFDATRNQWIDLGMDDYGAYDVSSSPGWSGNAITWTEIAYPKLHGAAQNDPRVVTKVNDRTTVSNTGFNESSGKRVTIKTTCSKRP